MENCVVECYIVTSNCGIRFNTILFLTGILSNTRTLFRISYNTEKHKEVFKKPVLPLLLVLQSNCFETVFLSDDPESWIWNNTLTLLYFNSSMLDIMYKLPRKIRTQSLLFQNTSISSLAENVGFLSNIYSLIQDSKPIMVVHSPWQWCGFRCGNLTNPAHRDMVKGLLGNYWGRLPRCYERDFSRNYPFSVSELSRNWM